MPRYDRILVRYRLPESNDQWSELQWCDIEKTAEDGSIQVRVAPAQDAVMPEDIAFTVLPQEDAKKLLVWDVSGENNHAYCLVIQANGLYRFDFNRLTSGLTPGQYWSFETNDYDINQSALPLTFNEKTKTDKRMEMRTSDSYNYTQLNDKAEKLPTLKLQYTAWQQKIIQDLKRKTAEQDQQKQLEAERRRVEAERNRKQQEEEVTRPADPVKRSTLIPDQDESQDTISSDFALALKLQKEELAPTQNTPIQTQVPGGSPAFFPPHRASNPPPRLELKQVILALIGAALIGYGLYMLTFTSSPWIGIGVIGLAVLCVCAAVMSRRLSSGAHERAPTTVCNFEYRNLGNR